MSMSVERSQVDQQLEHVKNYNIYALGPSRAGKTTFLPCMYNYLKFFSLSTGFFLRIPDPEKAIQLTDINADV